MSKQSSRRFFTAAGHRCGYCGRDLLESFDTFLGRRVGRIAAEASRRPKVACCSTCLILLRRTCPASIEEGRETIARHRAEAERNFAWLQGHGREVGAVADVAIEEGPSHE